MRPEGVLIVMVLSIVSGCGGCTRDDLALPSPSPSPSLGPCDDGDACTVDRRDADGRCVSSPSTDACDDGDACTVGDQCARGACVGTPMVCEDGDACTVGDRCERGACVRDPVVCDDGEWCTTDRCEGGACVALPMPDGAVCGDGDVCTVADRCRAGRCAGERPTELPRVLGRVSTFGSGEGRAVLLGDGRVVFVDEVSEASSVMSVVSVAADGTLSSSPPVSHPRRAFAYAVALGARAFVLLSPAGVFVYEVAEDGSVRERGRMESAWSPIPKPSALGDVLYVCSAGELVTIDVSDLDAPRPVSARSAPDCRDIAVDLGRRALWVASSTTVRRFELHDARAPALGEVTPVPGDVRALDARDGVVALAYDGSVDLRSNGTRARIEIGERVRDVWVEGDRLLVSVDGGLLAYDLTTPSAPALLGREDLGSEVAALDEPLQVDTRLLLPPTAQYLPRDVFVRDAATTLGWRRVVSPRLGSVGFITDVGGRLSSWTSLEVRGLDVRDPRAPRVDRSGGRFPRRASVVGLGEGRVGALRVSGFLSPTDFFAFDGSSSTRTPGAWIDASASTPAVLGEVSLLTSGVGVHARGHYFALESYMRERTLRVLALDEALAAGPRPGVRTTTVAPVTSMVVVRDGHDGSGQQDAMDMRGERLVLSTLVRPSGGALRSRVMLFDVQDPRVPTTLAQIELPGAPRGYVRDVAVDGDRVVYLESFPVGGDDPLGGTALGVLRVEASTTGAALREVDRVDLPRSGHILTFERGQVVVSGAQGLIYLRLDEAGAATIAHRLELPQTPMVAQPFDDHLIVGGRTEVTVVSPPCLPP